MDSEMASATSAAPNGPAPIAVYLYAGDQIIENVTTGYFYYQDSLGNTSHVTDSVGNLLERYTYDAFGMPTFYNASPDHSRSLYGIRHLFQGQLWTQETSLNDYRNRVELPTMGVFLQPDPIGFEGDAANIYRFCHNNGVNRIDPMGLDVNILSYRDDDITKGLAGPAHPPNGANWPKTFIYAGHGAQQDYNLGQVKDPRYKLNIMGSGPTIPMAKVVESITKHGAFKSSAQILFAVCSAGAPMSSAARDLAIATGKPVIAPDKMLWFNTDGSGSFIVADPLLGDKGKVLGPNFWKPGALWKHTPDGKRVVSRTYLPPSDKKSAENLNPADWTPAAAPGPPTAKDIDMAHQATGVPSLGAEAVNHVKGRL